MDRWLTPVRKVFLFLAGLTLVFSVTACQKESIRNRETIKSIQPSVRVTDQPFNGSSVTLTEVVTTGPTWVAVHTDRLGRRGQVVGTALLWVGTWNDVVIQVDPVTVTDDLHVVLYADRGRSGVFEPASTDGQIRIEGQVVFADFSIRDEPLLPQEGTPGTITIRITGAGFDPNRVTVPTGTTVVWVNENDDVHTVTAEDRGFVSGSIDPGDQFQVTFDEPGQYPYFCELWGGPGGRGMARVIVVRD